MSDINVFFVFTVQSGNSETQRKRRKNKYTCFSLSSDGPKATSVSYLAREEGRKQQHKND